MCVSTKPLIELKSLSRKNVLKRTNDTKNASEVRPWIPLANPCSSVLPAPSTAPLTSFLASDVSSAPASFAHPSTLSSACDAYVLISSPCSTIPPRTSSSTMTPSASNISSTRAAPAARDLPALQRVDERPGDCGGDRSDDDRHEDRRDRGENPDRPDQQDPDAHEEPREESQVFEPVRRGEHASEVGGARVRLRGTGGEWLVLPVSAPMKSRDIHVTIQTDSTPRRHHLGRVLENVIPSA